MASLTDTFFSRPWLWDAAIRIGKIAEACGIDVRPPPLQVTRYTIASSLWPEGRKPLKIAFASDFHVGCTTLGLDELEAITGQISALGADMVLLPGDFVNSPYGRDGIYIEPGKIAEIFASVKAPSGVYATLGNHDFYEEPYTLVRALHDAGISVLHNYNLVLDHDNAPFVLVGVGDSTTGQENITEAFS